jgi:outer membrane protein TolC
MKRKGKDMKKFAMFFEMLCLTGIGGGTVAAGEAPAAESVRRASVSIEEVLRSVETNNGDLKAAGEVRAAQALQERAANNLPDPTVSYAHQFGNRAAGGGLEGELLAVQGFDFPTAYAARSRFAALRIRSLDLQYAAQRQQTLLKALEACLDILHLRRRRALLDERLAQTERLAAAFDKRLAAGDATALEVGRIGLELLNIRTALRRTEGELLARQGDLQALNGGVAIACEDIAEEKGVAALPPFDVVRSEALAADLRLLTVESDASAARQRVSVAQATGWPALQVGYQLNVATGGERFSGFVAGISLPLFSNRYKVRQARAEVAAATFGTEAVAAAVETELEALYRSAAILWASLEDYGRLLEAATPLPLLQKALDSGKISIVEYFVEQSAYAEALLNQAAVENDYRKSLANLLKYRL